MAPFGSLAASLGPTTRPGRVLRRKSWSAKSKPESFFYPDPDGPDSELIPTPPLPILDAKINASRPPHHSSNWPAEDERSRRPTSSSSSGAAAHASSSSYALADPTRGGKLPPMQEDFQATRYEDLPPTRQEPQPAARRSSIANGATTRGVPPPLTDPSSSATPDPRVQTSRRQSVHQSSFSHDITPAPPPLPRQQQQSQSLSSAPRTGHSYSQSASQVQPKPPQQNGGGGIRPGPPTIAGEPLHQMSRPVALVRTVKFYAEGFLMRRIELDADGTPHPGAHWSKWFVQLTGTTFATWDAAEMEQAARENRTVPPEYHDISNSFVHPSNPSPGSPPSPTEFQFTLSTSGLDRTVFCTASLNSLNRWVNAFRLAAWEHSRCSEIYTGTLLGLREPSGGWIAPDANGAKLEGWVRVRLPGDLEFRRAWAILLRGGPLGGGAGTIKKAKRHSFFGRRHASVDVPMPLIENLPGDGTIPTLAFFEEKPVSPRRDKLICIAQHLYFVSALFPKSERDINTSSLFKIEGTFLNPEDGFASGWGVGGRTEKQGFALLKLEDRDTLEMLPWIVALTDAFRLYGRSSLKGFSYDPRDPSSLYFALPVGMHRDRLFLDREMVDNLDVDESRPRAIRATFHNILFDRMRTARPTRLEPPPPSPPAAARASVEDLDRQQQQKVDAERQRQEQQERESQERDIPVRRDDPRRWSRLSPQEHDRSAPSSPLLLPPITEASPDHKPLYATPDPHDGTPATVVEVVSPPALARGESPRPGSTRNYLSSDEPPSISHFSSPDPNLDGSSETPSPADTASSDRNSERQYTGDIVQTQSPDKHYNAFEDQVDLDPSTASLPSALAPVQLGGSSPVVHFASPTESSSSSTPTQQPAFSTPLPPEDEEVSTPLASPNVSRDVEPPRPRTTRLESDAYHMPDEQLIHSDLLAALDFTNRSESPQSVVVPDTPSTTAPSPVVEQSSFHFGPPSQHAFPSPHANGVAASAFHEELAPSLPTPRLSEAIEPDLPTRQIHSPDVHPVPGAFPSVERAVDLPAAERAEPEPVAVPEAEGPVLAKSTGILEDGNGPEPEPLEVAAASEKVSAAVENDDSTAQEFDPRLSPSPSRRTSSLLAESVPGESSAEPEQFQAGPPSPPSPSLPPAPRPRISSPPRSPNRPTFIPPTPIPIAALESITRDANDPRAVPSPAPPSPPPASKERDQPATPRPTVIPIVIPPLHPSTANAPTYSSPSAPSRTPVASTPVASLPSNPPPPLTVVTDSPPPQPSQENGSASAFAEQERERQRVQFEEFQRQQMASAQMGYGGYGGYHPMMGGYGMMPPWGMQMGMPMGGMRMPMGYGSLPTPPTTGRSPIPSNDSSVVAGGGGGELGQQSSLTVEQEALQAQQQQQQAQIMHQQAVMAAQQAAAHAAQQAFANSMAFAYQQQQATSPVGTPSFPAPPYGGMPYMQPAWAPAYPLPQPSFGGGSPVGGPTGGYGAAPGGYGFNPYLQQQQAMGPGGGYSAGLPPKDASGGGAP